MANESNLAARMARWVWRAAIMPHRVTESLDRLRAMEILLRETRAAPPADAPVANTPAQSANASPSQIYRGYSDDDLAVFGLFAGRAALDGTAGFVTDFLGVRTRTRFVHGMEGLDNVVQGIPVPDDGWHSDAIEWIGLLKSVAAARGGFAAMELGAGWGPWVVTGARAARLLGIGDIRLCAVEADPGHFASLLEHFHDNGLDPAAHHLVNGAVGVENGTARWPKLDDPAADWGSRPVTTEADEADYLGRRFAEWLDIRIVAFPDLLRVQAAWDLVHIDVQGWEVDLCVAAGALLDRVRWLVVATHDAKLHGDMLELMFRRGWVLENEKPPRFQWNSELRSLIAMTTHDGTQVWRNPKGRQIKPA